MINSPVTKTQTITDLTYKESEEGVVTSVMLIIGAILAVIFLYVRKRYTLRNGGQRLWGCDAQEVINIVPTGRKALFWKCWGNKAVHGTRGCGTRLEEVRVQFMEPAPERTGGHPLSDRILYSVRLDLWKSEDGGKGRLLLQCPQCKNLFEKALDLPDIDD